MEPVRRRETAMGEGTGIDEALLAAVEETKAKLRRAAQAAAAGGDEAVAQGPAGAGESDDGAGDDVSSP
jgi:hypothetical protein